MNQAVRRVALVLGLAFVALLVNLNVVQLAKSDQLANHPANRRLLVKEYATYRGEIMVGNRVIAESVESGNPTYRFERRYPLTRLYGHITGYYSFYYGASGIERRFNDYLLGSEPVTAQTLLDRLLGREPVGNVVQLTLDHRLQRIARDALDGQRGAVAAVDPRTGAVLALYANPTYDPNPLSQDPRNDAAIREAWQELNADPVRPLTFAATQRVYPPGSTFKIVTAAAGLLNGMSPTTSFPDPRRLALPDTNRTLGNYQGGSCAGGSITMAAGFRVSCNTTFAQVAMRVGAEEFGEAASRFGINRPLDFDLPSAASCVVNIAGAGCDGPEALSRPGTAYSGIGQQDVRITPLQMALIAATVGNGGFRVKPYLVHRVVSPEGEVLLETEPERERALPRRVADPLRQMMVDTVRSGTGAVVGFRDARTGDVGGKTGTAEIGIPGQAPHVWFAAFAPGIAVAVVVEHGGRDGHRASGGRTAGPIARALVDDWTARQGP